MLIWYFLLILFFLYESNDIKYAYTHVIISWCNKFTNMCVQSFDFSHTFFHLFANFHLFCTIYIMKTATWIFFVFCQTKNLKFTNFKNFVQIVTLQIQIFKSYEIIRMLLLLKTISKFFRFFFFHKTFYQIFFDVLKSCKIVQLQTFDKNLINKIFALIRTFCFWTKLYWSNQNIRKKIKLSNRSYDYHVLSSKIVCYYERKKK